MFARIAPRRAALMLAAAVILLSPAAGAETLEDALALAYTTNPALDAARAQVRAQDEQFVQARSQALPTVSGTIQGSSSGSLRRGLPAGSGDQLIIDPVTGVPVVVEGEAITSVQQDNDNFSASLQASQNLFRGGRTGAAMDQALANIYSARARLASTEQATLVAAVAAYVDVRRDEEILAIRANNVQVLERQLQASRDRFEVGEITRTDVSQAEARLADARSQYASAQAQLTASRAAYEQVIGQAPGTLEPEPPLPALPADLDAAFALAMENNPDVLAAAFAEDAAKASVRNAKGAMYPTVSVQATAQRSESYETGPFEYEGKPITGDSTSIGGRITVPLFSGNALSSSVRQARQNESSARLQLRDAERSVREAVSRTWSAYLASIAQQESSAESVRANELAFEGVEAEAAVGLRTTLDVLNAEQELLNARLALVQSERNAYVAGFALLQAVGQVNPEYLALDVEVYDPARNLRQIRRQYLGIGVLD
jgi:TolC family type I secretion outer membrane protein